MPWRNTNEFCAPMAIIKVAPDKNPIMRFVLIGPKCRVNARLTGLPGPCAKAENLIQSLANDGLLCDKNETSSIPNLMPMPATDYSEWREPEMMITSRIMRFGL